MGNTKTKTKQLEGLENIVVENEVKITDNDQHFMMASLVAIESMILALTVVKMIIKKARKSQAIDAQIMRQA